MALRLSRSSLSLLQFSSRQTSPLTTRNLSSLILQSSTPRLLAHRTNSPSFSTSSPPPSPPTDNAPAPVPVLVYEGPFAGLTLRLKRVSIFTATVGLIGMPSLLYYSTGAVPMVGQLAISGTATLAAVGSTVLLSFCVTPYVHTLTKTIENDIETYHALTGSMFGTRITTSFQLSDVESLAKTKTTRPFCNFLAGGKPYYVHGELFNDKVLLKKLVMRPLTKSEIEGKSGDFKPI